MAYSKKKLNQNTENLYSNMPEKRVKMVMTQMIVPIAGNWKKN